VYTVERLRPLLTVIVLLALPANARANLYVNEFLAVNDTIVADEDGDFSDWLEIYNGGASAVDLAGWYLTDDDQALTKWQLPSVVVGAGGYLLVWCSDKDRAISGSPLHTNFKLTSNGEYLALVQPDGSAIEHEYAPAFPPQQADVSYGLNLALSSTRCFTTPTPGAANDESTPCGVVDPVTFSIERGFYDAPFDVALSTTPGADIYFTTDGSEPTEAGGTLYTAPIHVATTTVLRAAGFATGLQSPPSVTHTYLFLSDVIHQTGAGFPDTWAADYEMDPVVVDDPRYAGTIVDDLKAIPTLSLVGDVDGWFGADDGIYSHPSGRGEAWERPISAELINPNGDPGFQINCGTRIQGVLSRKLNKKKSLRLAFKSIYGSSQLEFPLFADSPVDTFDKVRLRAGNEKSFSYGASRATYARDQWVRQTQLDMGQVASHGRFFHVYINGLYWGMYNAMEKPDEDFAAAYLGGSDQDWDILKHGVEIVAGDSEAWDTAHAIADAGLETPAAYALIQQYVDLSSLIDYFITNLHAGTTDWDSNNWYAGRRREPGAGFHFFSWDAELSMASVKTNRVTIDNPGKPSNLYKELRANPEFRILFADHLQRHFFDDGALTPENAGRRFMKIIAQIDRAIVGESARWGDARKGIRIIRDDEWIKEVEWLRLAYFPQRTRIILDAFRKIGLYPAVDAPSFNQHGGRIAAGFALEIAAPAGTIYYTDDGSDPREVGGAVAATAQVDTGPIVLNDSREIRARAQDGGTWSALTAATFTVDVPVRISEIMYHPSDPTSGPYQDDDFEYVELTNVGAAPVDLGGFSFTDGIIFTFPSGALSPGDHVLVVSNQAAFETRYGTGLPIAGQYSGHLANGGEHLHLEGAGSVIHDFAYDDAWYPATDGLGHALVVRDAGQDVALWGSADGWRASTFDLGSPGAAELPLCDDGVDNDGDSATDFPADAGCASATQDLEDPACDDGRDNDGDDAIDLADPACASASDTDESPDTLGYFACYKARPSTDFDDVETTLANDVDPEAGFTVRRPRAICVPASVSGSAVLNESVGLEVYPIRQRTDPKHEGQDDVFVRGLGPIYLDTKKPDRLLIPTAFDESTDPTAPVAGTHEVDRYECYRASTPGSLPKFFPRGVILDAADEFESRRYRFIKPTRLCLPADVGGQGTTNPAVKLLCYKAKRDRGEPRHDRIEGLHTSNEYGTGLLDTRKLDEICTPAE
jgi:hypothetical protein